MTESTTALRPARARSRRLLRRLAITLIVLAVASVACVLVLRAVLAGDTPRRILVEQLSSKTGLRVEIGEATVGWRGQTVLRDVVITLPLETDALFTAPVIEVSHAGLFAIVIAGHPGLDVITIPTASLAISEDGMGRWSPVRAASIVQASLRSSANDGGAPKLPSITIHAAAVTVSRPNRPPVQLQLSLDAEPIDLVSYSVDATLGASRVKAAIAIPSFEHSVNIDLAGVDPLLELFDLTSLSPLALRATWTGGVRDKTALGVLSVLKARAGDELLSGSVRIVASEEEILAEPGILTIHSPRAPRSPFTITGGSVVVASSSIALESARMDVAGLSAMVSGRWNLANRKGEATLAWNGDELNASVTHHGSAHIRAAVPTLGTRTLTATLHSSGHAPGASWNIDTAVDARASDWNNAVVSLTFPTLRVTDAKGPIDLSGVQASITAEWPEIMLTTLTVPGAADLTAAARYNTTSNEWSLDIRTTELNIPRVSVQPAVHIKGSGDLNGAQYVDAHISLDGRTLSTNGSYIPDRAVPLVASVQVQSPMPLADAANAAPGPAPFVAATLDIRGRLNPLALHAWGVVSSSAHTLPGGTLEPIEVHASIDAVENTVVLQTLPLSLLGGVITASGTFDRTTSLANARLNIDSVDLATIATLGGSAGAINGTGSTSVSISVPGVDISRMHADADWHMSNVIIAGQHISEGRGRATLKSTALELHDIHLTEGAATLTGAVCTDIASPTRIFIDLTTSRWPLQLPDVPAETEISLTTRAMVDLDHRTAHGKLDLLAHVITEGERAATLALTADLEGRTVAASSLRAELLGGVVTGSAGSGIDDWTNIVSDLTVTNIDLAQLARFVPQATGLRGTLSGTINTKAATGLDPLAPLQIDAEFKMNNGGFRTLEFSNASLRAFAGPERMILDRSTISLASGVINAWSRLSFHDGEPFLHLSLAADALDINPLIHAAKPDAPHLPGRLTGTIIVGGYVHEPHRAFGEAELLLTDSDLGRLPVIANLYGLLKLDAETAEPRGTGQFRLRLDGDALSLTRGQYFNRGTDVLGSARIDNIWHGGKSPIAGAFAAALRPLKDAAVPLGKELDRLLSALFSSAVSVRVDGTLEAPVTQVVPFADISSGFKRIFVGAESGKTP